MCRAVNVICSRRWAKAEGAHMDEALAPACRSLATRHSMDGWMEGSAPSLVPSERI